MNSDLIKSIRYFKGMTQPQFSEWLGVAESSIAQVESGHRNVSEALKGKIALHFDVNSDDFIQYHKRRENTNNYFTK